MRTVRKVALVSLLVLGWLLPTTSTSADGPAPRVAIAHGLGVEVPAGWHVVRQRVSDVLDPYPRLAMATFAVRLSPHSCECGTPNLENLPRRGAFLLVWEYLHVYKQSLTKIPSRPSRFTVAQDNRRWSECAGPSWGTSFRAAGRVFGVEVYFGRAAGKQVFIHVDQILDSLRVSRVSGD